MRQIGIEPERIFTPDIDETPRRAESPRAYALRMAVEKLGGLPTATPGFALAADTVVAAGTRILPKTETAAQARQCLTLLAGRRHRVYTAIAIRAPGGKTATRTAAAVVGFARLDESAIDAYLACGEWSGKAGGYAIQGRAASFIDFVSGSYSAVVGLPLYETTTLLRGLGWR
ncbi:MAG: Maf family protein [Acidocella sp.]|nr:Maf family protein [Acidocella sp.]